MLPTLPSSRRPDLRLAAIAVIAGALQRDVETLCTGPDPSRVDQVLLEAVLVRVEDLDRRLTDLTDDGYDDADDHAVQAVETALGSIVDALRDLDRRRGTVIEGPGEPTDVRHLQVVRAASGHPGPRR